MSCSAALLSFHLPPPPPPSKSTSQSRPPFSLAPAINLSSPIVGDSLHGGDPIAEKRWLRGEENTVRMPTAPWMTAPLLPAQDFIETPTNGAKMRRHVDSRNDQSLAGKVRGGMTRKAMKHIMKSITNLRSASNSQFETHKCEFKEDAVLFDFNLPNEPLSPERSSERKIPSPWKSAEQKMAFSPKARKERTPTAADLVLAKKDLAMLRYEAMKMRSWVKAKKAGLTPDVVDEIWRRWKSCHLVMIKFVPPLSTNMGRAREIVERKTGGFVVWRHKDNLFVYRGNCHKDFSGESTFSRSNVHENEGCMAVSTTVLEVVADEEVAEKNTTEKFCETDRYPLMKDFKPAGDTLFVRETNRLLDQLGPRFLDWWRKTPPPVDADMLPDFVPNFKPPNRRCPPRIRSKLTDQELTYLRKLAKCLPTHFALSRNKRLQGLAAAIIKLWERSPIAKIAIKVGIQNTNNQMMSYELKRLTGGILILRNKDIIILYRGKGFLTDTVAKSIFEREKALVVEQLKEEVARPMAVGILDGKQPVSTASITGTLGEFLDLESTYSKLLPDDWGSKVKTEAEIEKIKKELKEEGHKLMLLNLKIERSSKELDKLDSLWHPSQPSGDQEVLTEEERLNFHRMGLKLDKFLLLGRRGVYRGVIGSMFQHWKHREVVKVITMQAESHKIMDTARQLETESGGKVLAVEKLRSGHAIIIYRGKNFTPLENLLPENLLRKEEALRRSIVIQRLGSMRFFARQKERITWKFRERLRRIEIDAEKLETTDNLH